MRALVIDDSSAMRRILASLLKKVGFNDILEAGNGQEGLDKLRSYASIDLILVDWNMPIMTGIEFVEKARAAPNFQSVPIMMVTTESDISQMTRALEAGANEYVMKPFTPDIIRSKLELLGIVACPN